MKLTTIELANRHQLEMFANCSEIGIEPIAEKASFIMMKCWHRHEYCKNSIEVCRLRAKRTKDGWNIYRRRIGDYELEDIFVTNALFIEKTNRTFLMPSIEKAIIKYYQPKRK